MSATMKREDVIQLAREACDKTKVDAFYNGYWTITQDELERVIHIATQKAVAEERERCASLLEGRAVHQPGPKLVTLEFNQAAQIVRSGLTWVEWLNNLSWHCTAAIRARKDNT